ncbi:MAG: hypothetical protein PHG87_02620 [Candidatus Omnitrophica bacterium]|nr:hypothetical protein [Candidatus Omnitrophota bacterium]
MAQERPFTPEKQLLRLIEDPKLKPASFNSLAIKHQSLSLFSFSAWIGRVSFFKDWFRKQFQRPQAHGLDTKIISKVLGICILTLIFYSINNLYTSFVNLKNPRNLALEVKKEDLDPMMGGPGDAFVSKKTVSYFLEKIKQRDIFRMGQNKNGDTEVASRGPSPRIIEATQNLKLVGISWSDDPDAMIEDTKALRTFFVKRGGLVGGVKVQAIFKDKVILSYAEEEIELR